MLTMILLFASLTPTQAVSMKCTNGGSVETPAVAGPDGMKAALKVSSRDDASKNSHECEAVYQVVISGGEGESGGTRATDVMTADGEWGRKLSMRLSGFTRDGQHVLGMFSEDGKYPLTMLFDARMSDRVAKVIDAKKAFEGIWEKSCSETVEMEIIGIAEGGEVVVELKNAGSCGVSGRWKVDDSGGQAKRVGDNERVLNLYGVK